jgi:putative acetyltransferase
VINIRAQKTAEDIAAIHAINTEAFDRHGETAAFDEFRENRNDIVSLVATEDERILGHVLFSPVTLQRANGPARGMGLGQLAVLPEYQRRGIGQLLTRQGLQQLGESNCPFVIVVGHASYYPRFGFEPGTNHGMRCQWKGIPDDSFMVLFLGDKQRLDLTGTAYFDGL